MTESYLHFLWRYRRFELHDLRSTTGETIHIQQFGSYNTGEGPDFLNARIQIGDTLWAGNVEMHLKSSDWLKHKHADNYNNVILHVVLEYDTPIYRSSGEAIPTLELKSRLYPNLHRTYLSLWHNQEWIPCTASIAQVPDITLRVWLERLIIERFQDKTALIKTRLDSNLNHWEQTFYEQLCRSFGLKINAEPFERLARRLHVHTLAKHKNNLFQLEALILGTAGLLTPTLQDDYPKRLRDEFTFLKAKYKLEELPADVWHFKTRPANFPTIRMAQLARLVQQSSHLFSKVLETEDIDTLRSFFEVQLDGYWLSHYALDGEAHKERRKSLGDAAIDSLIINTIAPLTFLYGQTIQDDKLQDKAIDWLNALPPENNSIITSWQSLGVQSHNALDTQSLIHLKTRYCDTKRCLECSIGTCILSAQD